MDAQIFAAILSVVGSVVGGAVGGYMAIRASRSGTKEAFENSLFLQEQAQNNIVRAVILGFIAELNMLKGVYESEFLEEVMSLEAGKAFKYQYPIHQNYFTIYESNAALIGQVPNDELRSLIIEIYLRAKGLVDTHSYNNQLLNEYAELTILIAQNDTTDLRNARSRAKQALNEYGINIKANYLALIETFNKFHPRAEMVIKELTSNTSNSSLVRGKVTIHPALILSAALLFVLSFDLSVFPQQHQMFSERQIKQDYSVAASSDVIANRKNGSPFTPPTNFVFDAADTKEFIPARGTNASNVDWGLALSGGGVRSASFSVGVMKALYDKGLMDEIDVVSSVSGGGYASYWLFTKYDADGTKKFGEAAFGNDSFVQNLCELEGDANVFPFKSGVKAALMKKAKAFTSYEEALIRSFGNVETETRKLDFLNKSIKSNKAPYFIINTTLQSKKTIPFGRIVELTPWHIGNTEVGFYKWLDNDVNLLTISKSIAMSAAGVKKLTTSIPKYPPIVYKGKKFRLWDGGHSENLAALSLIRRGVQNIVIVDAEHDPNYKFGAYVILRKMLLDLKIKLYVEDIEDFLETPQRNKKGKRLFSAAAVSEGCAVPTTDTNEKGCAGERAASVKSHIYYIKMSRPKTIFAEKLLDACANERGERLSECIENKLNVKDPETNKLSYKCEKAAGINFDDDVFVYDINQYSRIIDRPKFWSSVNFMNTIGKVFPKFIYDFPQTTTYDQSFYRDQFEAFVGLGYLQAKELKINKDLPAPVK